MTDPQPELVHWLLGQGFTAAEIDASFSPMLLPARRILGDEGRYVSARQISERTGLDLDLLIRFQRAAGVAQVDDPDAAVFMEHDGDAATHIKRFLDLGIDTDLMITVVRVLAQGLANAAEVMNTAALAAVLHPGASEIDTARGTAALVGAAAPLLGPMVEDLLRMQLRHTLQTNAVTVSERAAGAPLPEARMIAASFADLVGFTALGEEVPPEKLERLANRLGVLAHDAAQGPVRFIKTIGDAVMFVSEDTAALVEVVLTLLEAAAEDEALPRLRTGIAYGSAVSRAGDWFGSPVNTASRVTGVARPGAVLVTASAREQVGADERFRWSAAGAKHLKGIPGDVGLFRVRRSGEPA